MPRKNATTAASDLFGGTNTSDAPTVPSATSGPQTAANDAESTTTPPTPVSPVAAPPVQPATAADDDTDTDDDDADDTDTATPGTPYLDLSAADAMVALIPAGVRVAVAFRSMEPRASQAGNPMLNYRAQIVSVIRAPENAPAHQVQSWLKRTIFGRLMFTPPNPVTGSNGTIGLTRKVFDAAGVPWASRTFATARDVMLWLAEVAPLFVGSVVTATVTLEQSDPTNPRSYDAEGTLYPDRNGLYAFGAYTPGNAPQPGSGAKPLRNVPQPIESDDDLPF